ncbi:MAG: GAF domain-containing protein, partial [Paracoccus sp. (in: a-proteobacteria)]|uniref:GAF domain-containing protein n=1 Tax=Paracoccus sp. TaxID=267 RepID=UPI0026E0FCBA
MMMPPAAAFAVFNRAISRCENQPEHALIALQDMAQAMIGARLFTVLRFTEDRTGMVRVWSSSTKHFPVGERRPYSYDYVSHIVFDEQQYALALDRQGIATEISDSQRVFDMGCQNLMMLPVVLQGRILGVVNICNRETAYTEHHVAATQMLLPSAIIALQLVERTRTPALSGGGGGGRPPPPETNTTPRGAVGVLVKFTKKAGEKHGRG